MGHHDPPPVSGRRQIVGVAADLEGVRGAAFVIDDRQGSGLFIGDHDQVGPDRRQRDERQQPAPQENSYPIFPEQPHLGIE